MANEQTKLLGGTLDLLILRALLAESRHGLAIARRIEQVTRGAFSVKAGSLFPALHRMEEAGWLESSWGVENGRRVKFYGMTRAGKKRLEQETAEWRRIASAMAFALEAP